MYDNDELVKLERKEFKKGIHLYCVHCFNYYCIKCLNKESMDKGKFPRCYHCYYRKHHPEIEPIETQCVFISCQNKSKVKGYCKRHYYRIYYLNYVQKIKFRKGRRKSFTRKKYPPQQKALNNVNQKSTYNETG